MSFDSMKALSRKLGLYPAARWVNRHLINRKELKHLQHEMKFYSQFVGPGSLCFDVGANYGAKTEVFLRLGAKVVCFEPQSDCIQELQARLSHFPNLTPVQSAVGSMPGTMTLYIEKNRTASSLVQNWQGKIEGSTEVPVTTLDEAIAKYGVPQLLKIDVEGFELEVFKGLNQPISIVSFEYHLRQNGADQAVECLENLSRFGELQVNITPAERTEFAQTVWWPKNQFIEYLRQTIPNMPEYDYGDIFVRISAKRPGK